MPRDDAQLTAAQRPRVGIPWRTLAEQHEKKRDKLDYYFNAVRKAGGDPQEVSLEQPPDQLARRLEQLDAFVLPGSPADVEPKRYGADKRPETERADRHRDATDAAILTHAFAASKPVLAICYGCQILNVHLKGSLIQDIRAECKDKVKNLERHRKKDPPASEQDPVHSVGLEPGSRLASLAGGTKAIVNSSHHQAVRELGEHLKVTARADDGIIEAVEWTGDANWVVGVQWHPERRPAEDAFARRLFEGLVAAAKAREAVTQKV